LSFDYKYFMGRGGGEQDVVLWPENGCITLYVFSSCAYIVFSKKGKNNFLPILCINYQQVKVISKRLFDNFFHLSSTFYPKTITAHWWSRGAQKVILPVLGRFFSRPF
jgi:hypothetical protein